MHLSFHYCKFIHKCINPSITANLFIHAFILLLLHINSYMHLSFHYCTFIHTWSYPSITAQLNICPAITAYLVIQVFILPLMHIYAFIFPLLKIKFFVHASNHYYVTIYPTNTTNSFILSFILPTTYSFNHAFLLTLLYPWV